jgi:hypothetical protein
MAKNWPTPGQNITLRNGEMAIYMGECDVSHRHRARVHKVPGNPKSLYTTWLLNDAGVCSVTGQPGSEHDWLGQVPA